MKCATSFFDPGIFKNILQRTWPLWALYFLCWFIAMPFTTLMGVLNSDSEYLLYYFASALENFNTASIVSGFIMGIVAAMTVFGFLFNSRSSGLIASLPVSRSAVFGSAYLAGLLPLIAGNLLIFILTVLCLLKSGIALAIVLKGFGFWFVTGIAYFFIFFSLAVFIAMLTGNSIAMPVLYVIFNFLAIGIEFLVGIILGEFVFGFSLPSAYKLEILSPLVNLLDYTANVNADLNGAVPVLDISYFTLPDTIIYCVFALALTFVSLLMFRRRRAESVGDVISVNALKPVFKYGVALCSALGFGIMLYSIVLGFFNGRIAAITILSIGMIIGALLGYLISEMLLKKSLHVFRGKALPFAVLSGLCIVFVMCCYLDVFSLGSRIPEASEVKYVYSHEYGQEFIDPGDIDSFLKLNKDIVENKDKYSDLMFEGFVTFVAGVESAVTDVESSVAGVESAVADVASYTVEFDYHLKNGDVISRSYTIYQDEVFDKYMSIVESPSAVLKYFTPTVKLIPENVSNAVLTVYDEAVGRELKLTGEQAVDFYNTAVLDDIKSGVLKNCLLSCDEVLVSFDVQLEDGTDSAYLSIPIGRDCTHCLHWLSDVMSIELK